MVAEGGGTPILPDESWSDGLAGFPVPNDDGFALVGDADGGDVGGLGSRLAEDLAGHERQVYVCKDSYDEPEWSMDCPGYEKAKDYDEWYTVCGTKHSNYQLYVAVVAGLALLGITVFRMAFSPPNSIKKKTS